MRSAVAVAAAVACSPIAPFLSLLGTASLNVCASMKTGSLCWRATLVCQTSLPIVSCTHVS